MNKAPSQVQRTALAWLLRRHDGPLDADEQRALDAWLAGDPVHGEALAELEMHWDLAAEAAGTAARPAAAKPRRRPATRWLAAAAVVLVLLAWQAPDWWLRARADHLTADTIATLTLDDGSRITLAPHSALRQDFDGNTRAVTLLRGEALFHPAPLTDAEPRPFTVRAGDARFTARGTRFWVRQLADARQVGVIEHHVLARLPGDRQRLLAAGDSARLSDADGIRLLDLDPARAAGWSRGVLVFDHSPLNEVLARINDFRQRPVLLLDRARGDTPVQAVLHLDNLDQGVPVLAAGLGLNTLEMPGLTLLY